MYVAAVQKAPDFLDREGTIGIVVASLAEAAALGAELIAFPETFVPGYPAWTDYTHASISTIRHRRPPLRNTSMLPSTSNVAISTPSWRHAGIWACSRTSASEKCRRRAVRCTVHSSPSIRNSASAASTASSSRRSVSDSCGPTATEPAWSPTSSRGLRVSGLNCWENWMPLARAAMYAQGTQVHVATWPGSAGASHDISRFMAREGRMFVVSAGAVLAGRASPDRLRPPTGDARRGGLNTTAAVRSSWSPTGEVLAEAEPEVECIITAELDLDLVRQERHNFDPTGHYSRSDVFDLTVDRRRHVAATFTDD